MPTVSVVMATFNDRTDFLEKSIGSVLDQTWSDYELIIIDDSTSPSTIQCLESFAANAKIRLFRNARSLGFVKSLNRGLRISQGDFVARMDADDIAEPRRLEKQVEFLLRRPHVDAVGAGLTIVDGDGGVVSGRSYPTGRLGVVLFSAFRSPLAHPSVVFRRSLVQEGFYYDESFRKAEDFELWLRMLSRGKTLRNLSEPLLRYRVLPDFDRKRDGLQRHYAYLAQRKNLRGKFVLVRLAGLAISFLFRAIPQKVFARLYRFENKRNGAKR